MKVLDFIREHADWEDLLAAEPYCIKASWDGWFVLLKYNQLASDFSEEMVRECRGCIFWLPDGRHEYAEIVCYPFDKFGNYGETYVPSIDWNHARVQEKVDGSLIKIWRNLGEWHVSTNGTIDARKAPTSVEGVSFYDVFIRALEKNGNPQTFFNSLDANYTYMFELVSPETRVTISYPESAIYYLGSRNMTTLLEEQYPPDTLDFDFFPFVKLPQVYPLTTLEVCIDAVNKMGADEEGFVVCDAHFNRIKIKSPEYLIAAHLRNNGAITVKRVIEAMRAGYIDDFYAYAPDYREFVDSVINAYNRIAQACEMWYLQSIADSKRLPDLKLHQIVKCYPTAYRDYCFKRHVGKVKDAYDYLENGMFMCNVVDWVREYIKDAD